MAFLGPERGSAAPLPPDTATLYISPLVLEGGLCHFAGSKPVAGSELALRCCAPSPFRVALRFIRVLRVRRGTPETDRLAVSRNFHLQF